MKLVEQIGDDESYNKRGNKGAFAHESTKLHF